MSNTCYIFFANISLALLQSSCYNLRLLQIVLFIAHFRNAFGKPKRKKSQAKIVVPKLHETILYGIRRDVQLDLRLAPIFWQSPVLKWIIILPENNLKEMFGLFINAKYVTETLTDFTICENISRRNTDHSEVQDLKVLILRLWWERLMSIAWKKNWKRANFFVGQCDREWETQSLQLCQRYSGPEISVGKVRCCVWQSQMCRYFECGIRLCAQKRTRRELWVSLCTRKDYNIGEIYICGYYRRVDKNQ